MIQPILEKIFLIIFLLTTYSCNSQDTKSDNIVNNKKNVIEFRESAMSYKYDCKDCIDIIHLLKQYHNGYDSWDSINRAWDTTYYNKYTYLDQALRGEIYFFANESDLTANLIDITKNEDSSYIARVLYSYMSKKNKSESFAIYNFYVKRSINGELKLVPYLEHSKKVFKKTIYNNIEIYESSNIPLTKLDFRKIDSWNDSISSFFNSSKENIKLFYTKNFVETYKIIGFDSYYKMNQNKVKNQNNGISDIINNIIYSPEIALIKHEMVHIYIFKSFNINNNYWVGEGLATFLAGGLEPKLEIDLKKLSNDFKLKPQNNFQNIFQYQNYNVDMKTSYMYTIFGLICKLIYEKEGKKGLLEFVNSGSSEDDVYKAIEKHLGISKNDANQFLRSKILEF